MNELMALIVLAGLMGYKETSLLSNNVDFVPITKEENENG